MKIDQYCQQQRYKHAELEQFWHAFASCRFVSDSWAFLLKFVFSHGIFTPKGNKKCNLKNNSNYCMTFGYFMTQY